MNSCSVARAFEAAYPAGWKTGVTIRRTEVYDARRPLRVSNNRGGNFSYIG